MATEQHPEQSPGQLLAQAREEAGIRLEDAARASNLTASMAQALEQDEYAALGQPVYARGYYRRYARVVGCDAEAIVQRYELINEVPSAVPQIQQRPSIPYGAKSANPGIGRIPWLGVFFALLLLAAVAGVWYTAGGDDQPPPPVVAGVTTLPSALPTVAPTPLPDLSAQRRPPTANLNQLKLSDELSVEESLVEQAEGPASTMPDRSAETIYSELASDVLEINVGPQAAWIEVRDARDERLAFRVAQPGEQLRFQGEPPYRINLGRAHTLELRLGGRSIDLQPVLDSASRARATITQGGELIAP